MTLQDKRMKIIDNIRVVLKKTPKIDRKNFALSVSYRLGCSLRTAKEYIKIAEVSK